MPVRVVPSPRTLLLERIRRTSLDSDINPHVLENELK